MAEIKVKYLGPARVLVVGGKEYFPGDTISMDEKQLAILAKAPAGNGIHLFDFADETSYEKVSVESRANAAYAGMEPSVRVMAEALAGAANPKDYENPNPVLVTPENEVVNSPAEPEKPPKK